MALRYRHSQGDGHLSGGRGHILETQTPSVTRVPLSPAWGLTNEMNSDMKEILIQCIHEREFLYDTTNPNYKDLEKKDNAWAEISNELDYGNGTILKAEWKKIRDNFRDALTRSKLKGGQATKDVTKYRFYNQLSFLIPFITSKGNNRISRMLRAGKQSASIEVADGSVGQGMEIFTTNEQGNPIKDEIITVRIAFRQQASI
uniref:(California timema) hypothetical protein n=1 Tax=Timema californicum TaxID=61474 RepID=A0A7R9IZL3_TIMCA|nr:unnamed protein product [Timema californicum]